jgi:hypothetical protein
MNKITDKQLDQVCDYLNKITHSPEKYRDSETGKIAIGHYHISHAYGGVCLHQTCNDGGGVRTPLSGGHIPKRDLFNEIHAFIKGIEQTKWAYELAAQKDRLAA